MFGSEANATTTGATLAPGFDDDDGPFDAAKVITVASAAGGLVAVLFVCLAMQRANGDMRRASLRVGLYASLLVATLVGTFLCFHFIPRPPQALAYYESKDGVAGLVIVSLYIATCPIVLRGFYSSHRDRSWRAYCCSGECRGMGIPAGLLLVMCLCATAILYQFGTRSTPRENSMCTPNAVNESVSECGLFLCAADLHTCALSCDFDGDCVPAAVCFGGECVPNGLDGSDRLLDVWMVLVISISSAFILFCGVMSVEFLSNAYGILYVLVTVLGTFTMPTLLAHKSYVCIMPVGFIAALASVGALFFGCSVCAASDRLRRNPQRWRDIGREGCTEATKISCCTGFMCFITIALTVWLTLALAGIEAPHSSLNLSEIECATAEDPLCDPFICDTTQSRCYVTCNMDLHCNLTSLCVNGTCIEKDFEPGNLSVPLLPSYLTILIAVSAGVCTAVGACCIGWNRIGYDLRQFKLPLIAGLLCLLFSALLVGIPLGAARYPITPLRSGNGTECHAEVTVDCLPYFCDTNAGKCYDRCDDYYECFDTWYCDTEQGLCLPQPPAYQDHKIGDQALIVGVSSGAMIVVVAFSALVLYIFILRNGPSNGERQPLKLADASVNRPIGSINDAVVCKVCLDATMNSLLSPCNHICVCMDCAGKLAQCPICRTPIAKVSKVYTA